MIIRKIPWIPTANWECSIDLSGEIYRLAVRWNGRASQWFFSLHRANGEHVALGVPMIVGADLLAGWQGRPPGALVVIDVMGNAELEPVYLALESGDTVAIDGGASDLVLTEEDAQYRPTPARDAFTRENNPAFLAYIE